MQCRKARQAHQQEISALHREHKQAVQALWKEHTTTMQALKQELHKAQQVWQAAIASLIADSFL